MKSSASDIVAFRLRLGHHGCPTAVFAADAGNHAGVARPPPPRDGEPWLAQGLIDVGGVEVTAIRSGSHQVQAAQAAWTGRLSLIRSRPCWRPSLSVPGRPSTTSSGPGGASRGRSDGVGEEAERHGSDTGDQRGSGDEACHEALTHG